MRLVLRLIHVAKFIHGKSHEFVTITRLLS